MNNPLQAMLEAAIIPTTAFPQDSRYYAYATQTYTAPDGTEVAYLQRRLVPQPEVLAAVGQYEVKQGDRLDLIAAATLADSILFWRICDANSAIRPDELVETIGRILRITLPQGVPGATRA